MRCCWYCRARHRFPGGAYIDQNTEIFALDSIRADSKGTFGPLGMIVRRMGVEPSPFFVAFRDISIGIVDGIHINTLPVLLLLERP